MPCKSKLQQAGLQWMGGLGEFRGTGTFLSFKGGMLSDFD